MGVPIAAGISYAFFGLVISPMIASAAMTFSAVFGHRDVLRLRKPICERVVSDDVNYPGPAELLVPIPPLGIWFYGVQYLLSCL